MLKRLLLAAVLLSAPLVTASEERARATTKEAEMMVHKAVDFLQKEGREKALAVFNDPKGPFTYLDLYVLAMDLDGKVVAHGKVKDYVGVNWINKKDAAGNFHFSRRILELGKSAGKGWLEYSIENPVTKKVENKVAYLERVGDLIVSCGVFQAGK